MLGFIQPHVADLPEIWVGDDGFKMEVSGTVRGQLFIRHAAGGTPSWGLTGGGTMPAGEAWWRWNSGWAWPDSFDLKPIPAGGKLANIPTGGVLEQFDSQAFPGGTVTHPVLDGGKTWTLTLRRSDGSGEEVGFLRRDGSTHELRWYAHKDKVSSGSRVDSTSDTLEFRSYEHDASCTTWCGANQVDEPCGHTFPYCSNFHTCDDADDCQAHAAGCSLKNNYREIVSAKKN